MNDIAAFYPATPPNIPRDLTTPTLRYRLQVLGVLGSLLLFVALYLALLAGSAYATYRAVIYPMGDNRGRVSRGDFGGKVVTVSASALLFLFLLKGLFKHRSNEDEMRVEITEKEQPKLYAFIRKLCRETGAPFPHRIFLSPEVNAAVFYNSSILSLVLPTPKNLLIGLGLVNVLNLSEFKAVLAHEFGHFSQSSMKLGSYVYMSNHIIADLIYGRDWFDDLLANLKSWDYRVSICVLGFEGVQWVLRKFLQGCFQGLNFANSALSRQMEFNADLVAVSVTGSDVIVHGLSRLDFASESLGKSLEDLSAAADHKLYTRDLFHHQTKAMGFLRKVKKDPQLGEPPALPEDPSMQMKIFEPGDDGVPLMWATHPSNFDREQNAKSRYIRSTIDERSPWVLFRNVEAVREKVTRRYYEQNFELPRKTVLEDPEKVQQFIDHERAETTYDEKYCGLYDARSIRLEDVGHLVDKIHAESWPREKVFEVQASLHDDAFRQRAEAYTQHQGEYRFLSGLASGEYTLKKNDFTFRDKSHGMQDVPRLLGRVEKDIETDFDWLVEFDRTVFLVHYQMAYHLNNGSEEELVKRYQFHLGQQDLVFQLPPQQAKVGSVLEVLSDGGEMSEERFHAMVKTFREAYDVLDGCLRQASGLMIPELKNMKPGESLANFLHGQSMPPPLSASRSNVTGEWISQFLRCLGNTIDKLRRINFKSLGGILALQEKVHQEWVAAWEQAKSEPKPASSS